MVLCASLRATPLTTGITYELLADNERAVCRQGGERRQEKLHGQRQLLEEKVLF